MVKKQLNVSVNQSFLQTVANIIIPATVNSRGCGFESRCSHLTFNYLTDLTHSITFFTLTLLHTVSEIDMPGLLYLLTYFL